MQRSIAARSIVPTPVNCDQMFDLPSRILEEERRIHVRLPESYRTADKRYPVLYMLDGELPLFTSHGGVIAQLSEWSSDIPELILVAIANTNRPRDMIPVAIDLPNGKKHGGGADRFLEFLVSELVPAIERTYRTHPYRILSGTSASGLTVAHAMATGLEGFRAFVASSPTVGSSERALFERVDRNGIAGEPGRFFAIFTGDEDMSGIQEDCEEFAALIRKRAPGSIDVRHWIHKGEGHCPFDGFRRALLALYEDWQPSDDSLKAGLDAVLAHFERLSRLFGYPIDVPISAYESIGERMIGSGDLAAAIGILREGMKQHIGSTRIAFYLAVALARSAQRDAAKKLLEELVSTDRPGSNRLRILLNQLED